jgi:hypothetical protein
MLILKSFQFEMSNYDSEDIVYMIKNFFDEYTENLKKKLLTVDKILTNNNTEYITDFNIDDILKNVKAFEEDVMNVNENDLKNLRNDKQTLDEKNIDFETRNKILKNRINIANSEINKITSDYNNKNSTVVMLSNDIQSYITQSEHNLNSTNSLVLNLLNGLENYQKSKN